MRAIAEAIGWLVIALFILGALGIADFRLTFKPRKMKVHVHDNTIINACKNDPQ